MWLFLPLLITKYDTVELVLLLLMSNLIYIITFISYQGHAVIVVEIYFNIDVARSLMLTKLCCSNDGQWFFNLFQVIELWIVLYLAMTLECISDLDLSRRARVWPSLDRRRARLVKIEGTKGCRSLRIRTTHCYPGVEFSCCISLALKAPLGLNPVVK